MVIVPIILSLLFLLADASQIMYFCNSKNGSDPLCTPGGVLHTKQRMSRLTKNVLYDSPVRVNKLICKETAHVDGKITPLTSVQQRLCNPIIIMRKNKQKNGRLEFFKKWNFAPKLSPRGMLFFPALIIRNNADLSWTDCATAVVYAPLWKKAAGIQGG